MEEGGRGRCRFDRTYICAQHVVVEGLGSSSGKNVEHFLIEHFLITKNCEKFFEDRIVFLVETDFFPFFQLQVI